MMNTVPFPGLMARCAALVALSAFAAARATAQSPTGGAVTGALADSLRAMTIEELRARFCPRGGVNGGGAILLGFVRDADADSALAGGSASLVFKDLVSGANAERVRTSRVGTDGRFAICGLPSALNGTVQVSREGQVTADVAVETKGLIFSTVSVTFATTGQHNAVLTGRVIQSAGLPVPGAQVAIEGTPNVARTDSLGRYRLEGLPSGTVEAVVRRIGFASLSQAVMLNQREPRRVDFQVSDARVLAAVRVVGKMDTGLDKVGFNERKLHASGHFLTPDEIEKRQPTLFTDLLQVMSGIKVESGSGGRVIASSRPGGCVNLFINDSRFESYEAGDVDNTFAVDMVGAVETYSSSLDTPVQFQVPGRSCATVVMWTKDRLIKP